MPIVKETETEVEEEVMSKSRKLGLAVAQMGPVHLADDRRGGRQAPDRPVAGGEVPQREVRRVSRTRAHHLLSALLDERAKRIERFFETRRCPTRDVQPLFDAARAARHRLLPRLCGADRRRAPLQHGDHRRPTRQDRRPNTARSICRATPITSRTRRSSISRRSSSKWATGLQGLSRRWARSIGMCICNDRRWPETCACMALQGAEIVRARLQHAVAQHPLAGAGAPAHASRI